MSVLKLADGRAMDFTGRRTVMGLKTTKSLFFYFGIAATAFMSLASSAYSQNRLTPSATQTWADPGAIEKARNEAGTEGQSKISAPSPAAPAFSGNEAERLSSPSVLKRAKNLQTSSNVGADGLHKPANGPVEHTVAFPGKHHESPANHASSSGQARGFSAGHKGPVVMGYAENMPRLQSKMINTAHHNKAPVRAQHVAKVGLTSKTDAAATATAGEFDPIYGYANINGYSNMISVAY